MSFKIEQINDAFRLTLPDGTTFTTRWKGELVDFLTKWLNANLHKS